MGEIRYAEPPRSPVASSAAELKIAAAITRAVNTPPTSYKKNDGVQVVQENGAAVFTVVRAERGKVNVTQLKDGPFEERTIRHLRSVLNMAVLPAFAFNGWDGKLQGAILKILPAKREDAMGLAEIVKALRGSKPQISAALNTLVESGEVQMERLKKQGAPKIFWRGEK
jgi:hypothetical protein